MCGRIRRNHGAISLDDIDDRPSASKFDRHKIASHGSARQQNALPARSSGSQSFEQTLGDVLLRNTVDLDMQSFDRSRSRRADRTNFRAQGSDVRQPFDETRDSVRAGEDQPVIRIEARDRAIQRSGIGRRLDLDHGQQQNLRA